jgi:hypothetical protein
MFFEFASFSDFKQDGFLNVMAIARNVERKRLRPTLPDFQGEEYASYLEAEKKYIDLMVQVSQLYNVLFIYIVLVT